MEISAIAGSGLCSPHSSPTWIQTQLCLFELKGKDVTTSTGTGKTQGESPGCHIWSAWYRAGKHWWLPWFGSSRSSFPCLVKSVILGNFKLSATSAVKYLTWVGYSVALEAKAGWVSNSWDDLDFSSKPRARFGGEHKELIPEPWARGLLRAREKWETVVAENTPGKPSLVLCLGLGSIWF